MKNKSWQYPFPTFADKYFDSNKDGKLDTFETAFRDMYLNELNRKAEDYRKTEGAKKQYTVYYNDDITAADANENKKPEKNTSSGVQLVTILLVVIISVIGVIAALSTKGTIFTQAMIIFVAFRIGKALLKAGGVYK